MIRLSNPVVVIALGLASTLSQAMDISVAAPASRIRCQLQAQRLVISKGDVPEVREDRVVALPESEPITYEVTLPQVVDAPEARFEFSNISLNPSETLEALVKHKGTAEELNITLELRIRTGTDSNSVKKSEFSAKINRNITPEVSTFVKQVIITQDNDTQTQYYMHPELSCRISRL